MLRTALAIAVATMAASMPAPPPSTLLRGPSVEFFAELGAVLDDEWRKADYDERAFPDIAACCLEKRRPSENVDFLQIVDWVHSSRDIRRTTGFESDFGQPAVRVFQRTQFHIDVLFWLESTTEVHQHGFCGAFHVMQGSSLHSRFGFCPLKSYNSRLILGELSLVDVELLERGAVRPIPPAQSLIHSLFHLDHPSVSVVVRTPGDGFAMPQYSYSRAGIAYDPFYSNESLYLRTRTLVLLRDLAHEAFLPTAVRAVRDADACDAFHIMRLLLERMSTIEEGLAFLGAIAPAHPDLLPRMRDWHRSLRRDVDIIVRRRDIQHKEHRFLLALLLNLQSRERLLELVARAYPGAPPVERVVHWLTDLSQTTTRDRRTGEATTVFGLRLDDVSTIALRGLIAGANDEQIIAAFKDEFDDGHVEKFRSELLRVCDRFRRSLLLGEILSS